MARPTVPATKPGPKSGTSLTILSNRFNYAFGATQVTVAVVALAVGIANAACAGAGDDACDETTLKGFTYFAGAIYTASTGIDMASKFFFAFKALKAGQTVADTLPAIDMAKGVGGKAAGALAIVGFAIGVGFLIAELVYTLQAVQGFSDLFLKEAIANFVGQLIWAIITLVLNFIPGIGQIISAILAFLDALVALITGGESTLGKLIVQFFYDVKIGTELKELRLQPSQKRPQRPRQGHHRRQPICAAGALRRAYPSRD